MTQQPAPVDSTEPMSSLSSRSDVSELIENMFEKDTFSQSSEAGQNILEHYGVPGMRWGRRKGATTTGPGSGARGSKPSASTSSDFQKTAQLRGKKPSQLSDKQLKKVNERINMEMNYRKLNPTKLDRGEARINKMLKTAKTVGAVATVATALLATGPGRRLVGKGAALVLPYKADRMAKSFGYSTSARALPKVAKAVKIGVSGPNPFKRPIFP